MTNARRSYVSIMTGAEVRSQNIIGWSGRSGLGLSVQGLGMKRRTMVGRCSLELLAGKSYTVSMVWLSNTNKRAFLDLRPQVLFAHFVHVGVDVLGMVPVIEHAVDAGFIRATEPNFLSKKEETGINLNQTWRDVVFKQYEEDHAVDVPFPVRYLINALQWKKDIFIEIPTKIDVPVFRQAVLHFASTRRLADDPAYEDDINKVRARVSRSGLSSSAQGSDDAPPQDNTDQPEPGAAGKSG
ncbi:hypothetical protein BR93DRAFT_984681 [Coniochaeta sp. PMI_546]|nr:hypothetical protein BR93DRAFT_984681 [Coniochaeta sp. PMI_546]